jgi:uncharacterized protein YgiM (DUF1202 family)
VKRHLILSLSALLCLASTGMAASKLLYVEVKDGEVRSTPTYLGTIRGTAKLGTHMTVIETKGAWLKVSTQDGKLKGWMHKSLLSKKAIKMKAGDEKAALAASAAEAADATKGFNSEVEKAYRAKNPDIKFDAVEKMLKIKVKEADLVKFLKDGDVTLKEEK